jgi:hypothetical protein
MPERKQDRFSKFKDGEDFNHRNTFFEILPVDFEIITLGRTNHHERCLACYPADKEKDEKDHCAQIANERLTILYEELEQVAIKIEKNFFN